ncbi:type II secretion system protein GspC [Vibrio sp.]|uniref:type II secretion system protein GspC n=1 Tax=Vibrio sp. TaxID=678 RepID=UPI003D142F74
MDLTQWRLNGSWPLFLRYQSPLSQIFTILAVALSAWVVGQSFWFIFQPKPTVAQWVATAPAAASAPARLNIQSLRKSDLFGPYLVQIASPVTSTVKVDAPPTRLNLTLVGVVASTEQQRSLAVIANRGQQNTYGLHEEIEGTQAVLKAVFADRVIIDNSGRDETLMLEGREYQTAVIQQAVHSSSHASIDASVEDKLVAIRDEIRRNPQEVFKYVALSQVKQDDNIIGYRVSPGKDSALFQAVGLQAGDIAIQLNGLDLTDPSVMTQVFQSMSDLTELNLTVERDGQPHDIYIQF